MSLIYFSRHTGRPETTSDVVDKIVATSRASNPGLGLTGALLFSGAHFAQVLEGSEASVDQLMARVIKDPRHDQLIVLAREPITTRRFGLWSMAYSGPSQFVARHVTRLSNDPSPAEHARSVQWLKDLFWEFAEGPGAA